eukprot:399224-Amphidinium_carterae.1
MQSVLAHGRRSGSLAGSLGRFLVPWLHRIVSPSSSPTDMTLPWSWCPEAMSAACDGGTWTEEAAWNRLRSTWCGYCTPSLFITCSHWQHVE